MCDLSVIVTVYGVERYIERCATSIFEQTYKDFELICVNDCSKDNSEAILAGVIARYSDSDIRSNIIRHVANQGVSAARETGLQAAMGTYVLYIDADDYIAPDMLALLMQKIAETDADIVYCDYFEVKNNTFTPIVQAVADARPRYIAAAMLRQQIVWAPWNKIFRRTLASTHGVHWPAGINMGEDLVVMTKLFCHARKIEYVEKALYYYNRDNVNSYVNQFNIASCYQNNKAVECVGSYLRNLGDPLLLEAFAHTQLMARYQMAYTFDEGLIRLAVKTFPETDGKVLAYPHASVVMKIAFYIAIKKQISVSILMIKAIFFVKRKMARYS